MNRIYKVIWSRTRNCFIAVSELVHSNRRLKSEKRLNRKGFTAIVAAMALVVSLSGATSLVDAADITHEKDAENTIDVGTDNTTIYSQADPEYNGSDKKRTDYQSASEAAGNLIIGDRNAVGTFQHQKTSDTAKRQDTNSDTPGTNFSGDELTYEKISITGKNVTNPITGQTQRITVNDTSKTGQWMNDDINMSDVADNYLRSSYVVTGATVVGIDSIAEGNHSLAAGNNARVLNGTGSYYVDAYGKLTSDWRQAYYYLDRNGNKVTYNTLNDGGSYYTVKRYTDSFAAVALGNDVTADGMRAVVIGDGSRGHTDSIAIGGSNTADVGAVTEGYSNKARYHSIGVGQYNTADGYYSVVTGESNTAKGNYINASGYYNNVSVEKGIAQGYMNTVSGANGIAVGQNDNVTAENGVSIGNAASASAAGGVALGANATASTASGVTGYLSNKKTSSQASSVWTSTAGAVSVGSDSTTRQITNVSAGKEDTDAVNVAQLKAAMDAAGADPKFTVKANDGATGTSIGDTNVVNFKDGDNTTVTAAAKTDGTGVDVTYNVDAQGVVNDALLPVVYTDTQGNKVFKQADGTFKDSNGTTVKSTNIIASMNNAADSTTTAMKLANVASSISDRTETTWKEKLDAAQGATPNNAVNVSDLKSVSDDIKASDKYITGGTVTYDDKGKGTVNLTGTNGLTASVTGLTDDYVTTATVATEGDNKNKVTFTRKSGDSFDLDLNGVLAPYSQNDYQLVGNGDDETGAYTVDSNGEVTLNVKDKKGTGEAKTVKISGLASQSYVDDKGVTFGANSGTDYTAKLGSKVTVKGSDKQDGHTYSSDNVTTEIDGSGNITIKLDDNLKSNSVTVGKDGEPGKDGVDGAVVIHNGKDGQNGQDGRNAEASLQTHYGPVTLNDSANTTKTTGEKVATRLHYTDEHNYDHEVATMDDGLNFTGNNTGTTNKQYLNSTVKVLGEGVGTDLTGFKSASGNIAVEADGTDTLTVKLNQDLKNLSSVTLGDNSSTANNYTTINKDGITINNGPTITNSNTSFNNQQIHNVAAGIENTDVVNVSQLKTVGTLAGKHTEVTVNGGTPAPDDGSYTAGDLQLKVTNNDGKKTYDLKLSDHVATKDDGMMYSGDAGAQLKKKLNTSVNIVGGVKDKDKIADVDNIAVVADGDSTLTLRLAKDITGLNSITAGTAKMGNQTVDYTGGKTGKSEMGNYVTGLDNKTWDPKTNGIVSGRAATEDQLKAATENIENNVNNKTFGLADDKGNTVTKKLDEQISVVGGKTEGTSTANISTKVNDGKLEISLNKDVDLGKNGSIKAGNTTIDEGGVTTNTVTVNKVTIDDTGIHAGDQKITNVAAGTDATDAVNVSQLKEVEQLAGKHTEVTVEGGTAAGTDSYAGKDLQLKVTDTDGKKTYDLKLSDHVATKDDSMKYSGDTGDQLAMKLNENVNIKGGATSYSNQNNIAVVSDGKDTLNLRLAKDIEGLNSVTTNVVNATTINTTTIKAGDTTINNEGVTIKDGPTITKNEVNVAGNKITNVAPGEKATDAVNVGQLAGLANNTNHSLNKLGNRINRVGAGAAALAALHPLDFDPDDKWDFAAGYGNYRGANAASIGAFYRPNEDTMFSIGGSFGGGENMVNAGVSLKLGQGNHVSTSRVAMAREIKDLRKEVELLRSALVDVSSGRQLDPMKTRLFPDIPKNHWAYDAIAQLAGNGVIAGYPDGSFSGDRMMTRYEFAMIVYQAMQHGAAVSERLLDEFEPELERVRVDVISKDKDGNPTIERVRVIKDRN